MKLSKLNLLHKTASVSRGRSEMGEYHWVRILGRDFHVSGLHRYFWRCRTIFPPHIFGTQPIQNAALKSGGPFSRVPGFSNLEMNSRACSVGLLKKDLSVCITGFWMCKGSHCGHGKTAAAVYELRPIYWLIQKCLHPSVGYLFCLVDKILWKFG